MRRFFVLIVLVLCCWACSDPAVGDNNNSNNQNPDQGGSNDMSSDMDMVSDLGNESACTGPDVYPLRDEANGELLACVCKVDQGDVYIEPGQACPAQDELPSHPLCQTCFYAAQNPAAVSPVKCVTREDRQSPDWSTAGFECVCEDRNSAFNAEIPELGCVPFKEEPSCEQPLVASKQLASIQCPQKECESGIFADYCGVSRDCGVTPVFRTAKM